MRHRSHFVPFALGLALMTGLAGCSLLGEEDDNDDELRDDRISTRDRDDDDNRADRKDRELADEMRQAGIPTGAEVVTVGKGEDLSFTASDDGTIYVQDRDADDRVVYSGQMNRDERFRFDASTGQFMVDGRTVLNRDGNKDHKYRVFFNRE